MKRTQVFLTEQQVEKIESEAEIKGIKFSEMLRRLIDEHFDNSNIYEEILSFMISNSNKT